jgi:hypothetical protein
MKTLIKLSLATLLAVGLSTTAVAGMGGNPAPTNDSQRDIGGKTLKPNSGSAGKHFPKRIEENRKSGKNTNRRTTPARPKPKGNEKD